MKKLILLLTFIALLFSCNSDSNSSNNNSFTNSMDYEFTITINGEVHKIKGNTTNGIPEGQADPAHHIINNTCLIISTDIDHPLFLEINDVTESNYVSGQMLYCWIYFPNLLLGTNQVSVNFGGDYLTSLSSSLGSEVGFAGFQTVSGVANGTLGKLPITITDLGTTSIKSDSSPFNFGQTVKGNYSGTIYLENTTNSNYTIPVSLSIDFKALRRY